MRASCESPDIRIREAAAVAEPPVGPRDRSRSAMMEEGMTEKVSMVNHLKIIAVLHIVLGAMAIFAGLTVLLLMGGIAGVIGIDRDPDAAVAIPIISGIGAVICLILIVLWLPGLIGGIGLLRLAPWSRVFMIVISALDLLSVPFGTALGIYGIWALTRPESEALLARRTYQPAAY